MDRYVAVNQCLTIMYIMIEVARWGPPATKSGVRQVIGKQAIRTE